MKKIFKYIFLVALTGIFSSCVDQDLKYNFEEEEEDGLYLRFSLSMPEMQSLQTRGVLDDSNENPESDATGFPDFWKDINLYMFIFENQGSPESNYLRSLIHGDEIIPVSTAPEETGGNHPGKVLRSFKAKVDGTSENAIIHLVATNDPEFEEQLQNTTDRSELGLFYGANGLYTHNEYPAFWKRIDMEMPLNEENSKTDEFKKKLSHVQMVRNFCRVTVSLTTDPEQIPSLNGFRLLGYTLVNQVDHGYVAAYSESNRSFEEFEAADGSGNLNGSMKNYEEVFVTDGFVPARHPLSVRTHKEEEATAWLPAKGNDDGNVFTLASKYMFERPYQESHRTFVIVKGDFNDGKEARYFKLDIGTAPEWRIDEKTGFYPTVFENYHLIRNYSYDIVIKTVADEKVGSDDAQAVVPGPPANNVGTSVETKSLQNLSDGVDAMWVSNTKFIIVDDDEGHPVYNGKDVSSNGLQLWWRYIENLSPDKDDPKYNVNVSTNVEHDYPGMRLESNDDSGIFKNVTLGLEGLPSGKTADEYGDWLGATITINNPTDEVKQKTVRLYYSDNSGNVNVRLSRDVTFVMRKRWEFVNKPVKEEDMAVEVYPGAYSFENGVNPPYETLKEMRENILSGYVGSQAGAQLTVMFELPADLPQSIFPLDFTIGFDRQNVENAYVGNATVVTGNSMFEDEFNDNELGVQRMQFVKTVTWDYYNGDDTKKGHRLVCARFVTTNDVLAEPAFGDTKATTRVRVWNSYFAKHEDISAKDYKNCQGKFERASYDNVVDPTRTNYYWNFSYPEWATYFSQYNSHVENYNIYSDFETIFDNSGHPDDASKNENWSDWSSTHENPHTLNNLYFAGYINGTKDSYTNVSGTFMQVRSDLNSVTRSENNPELWFNLNRTSETGFTANMTIKATNNLNRSGSSSNWKYSDRDVTVKVLTKTANGDDKSYEDTKSTSTPSSRNNTSSPLDMNNLGYSFDIPANETITRVLIWSVMNTSNHGNSSISGETRYYSIEFTLTPK